MEDEIFLAAIDEGALVSKGSWFIAERESFVPKELFLRTTFAAASEENMTKAIERFSTAIRKVFGI
jgi:aromatic amino acid aminotransferase I